MSIVSKTCNRRKVLKIFASTAVIFPSFSLGSLFFSSEFEECSHLEITRIVQRYGAEFGGSAINRIASSKKGGEYVCF